MFCSLRPRSNVFLGKAPLFRGQVSPRRRDLKQVQIKAHFPFLELEMRGCMCGMFVSSPATSLSEHGPGSQKPREGDRIVSFTVLPPSRGLVHSGVGLGRVSVSGSSLQARVLRILRTARCVILDHEPCVLLASLPPSSGQFVGINAVGVIQSKIFTISDVIPSGDPVLSGRKTDSEARSKPPCNREACNLAILFPLC
jgi:hypothetical protein